MKKIYFIIISLLLSSLSYSQRDKSYVKNYDGEKIESLKKKLKNHLNVKNKRIKVMGKVKKYQESTEIIVSEPLQISIIENKK